MVSVIIIDLRPGLAEANTPKQFPQLIRTADLVEYRHN
jgi:hypothetical protein